MVKYLLVEDERFAYEELKRMMQRLRPFLAVGGLGRERGAGCTALASGQPGLDDCRYPLVRRVEL